MSTNNEHMDDGCCVPVLRRDFPSKRTEGIICVECGLCGVCICPTGPHSSNEGHLVSDNPYPDAQHDKMIHERAVVLSKSIGAEQESVPRNVGQLKDTGLRVTFGSGAQRDRGIPKGRPDLRAVHALHRYDLHNEKGASKYEARNWEKGMPLSEFFNSASRHADKVLAGYTDENHEDGWLWNVMHFIETRERIKRGLLPAELDDMPTTFAGQEPGF